MIDIEIRSRVSRDEIQNPQLMIFLPRPFLPLADSLTNSIKMLTRSDIILEKRVAADEEAARTEAEATAREVARLARAAANTRAAFDGALQNITAGVRQVEGAGGQTSPESALMKSSNITLVHFSSIVYL